MKNTISFTTGGGNTYLFSPFRSQVILCHPLIPIFHQAEQNSVDLRTIIPSNTRDGLFYYNESTLFPVSEARIELKQYRFLKRNGYFKPLPSIDLQGRLKPERIRKDLAQIKQIIFETTEDCNLDCTYCIYSKFYINKERGKRKFDFEQARNTLTNILSYRPAASESELIISFYGGEPLKNIRFIEQIVAFSQQPEWSHIHFRYTMTTNGLLLAKYADLLVRHNMDISVSLDGDAKGNQFRVLKNRKSSYETVINNIDHIKEKYPDYFDKHISFITVLHKHNSFGEVFDFFRSRYNKAPMTSSINTINVNAEYRDEFISTFLAGPKTDRPDGELMKEMFLNHPRVKEMADMVEKYSGFVFKNYFKVLSSKKGKKRPDPILPTATCLPFSMRVFLSADGSVLPCEHISRIFEIGKISDGGMSINPETIASMYNDYFDKITNLCNKCMLAEHCKECVFNTRIETDQPVCDFFTDEAKFARDFAAFMGLIEKDYTLYQRITGEAFHD